MIAGKVIADVGWHAVKRTISVIAVIAMIIFPLFASFQYGYRKGFAKASDRPTYNNVGTVVNCEPKPLFIGLKLGKLGLGGTWDRK